MPRVTRSLRQGILWEADGFRVTEIGLRVTGQPTLAQWGHALRSINHAKSAMQWALGDLLLYADDRKWADDAVEEIMEGTGLKRSTLMNYKSVAKAFPLTRRIASLTWTAHAMVASLPDETGDLLLASCTELAWGYEELRTHARDARKRRERAEQTFPDGTYGLLLARPPWRTSDHPQVMETSAIAALAPRVQAITAPDAVLYMHAMNGELQDALDVLRCWGFELRGHHVITQAIATATPDYMRERHSLLLVGTRGRPYAPVEPPDSIISAETERVADVLTAAYPDVPRVVLFANDRALEVDGWVTWDHSVPVDETEVTRAILLRADESHVEVEVSA
jgi:N6-adenosine-specific RNA methylase IME4